MDYNNDMLVTSVKNDIPLLYKKNEENELFNLSIVFDIGSYNNKKLPLAAGYFEYLATLVCLKQNFQNNNNLKQDSIEQEIVTYECSITLPCFSAQ